MSAPGTNVAMVEKNPVVALLNDEPAQRRIIPLLGAGADYGRVVAEVWLAVQANPKIMECAPLEIVKSVARAVATGGTIGRDVYLVPFKGKLEVIEDYKFLAKLIVQAGGARAIRPGIVYEGDDFDFEFGTSQFLRHKPSGAPGARKITHAYVIARVSGNEDVILVLARDEVEAVRRKSKSWSNGTLEEIPWYGMKTAVRRVAKLLPSNPRLTAALAKLGLTAEVEGDALPDLPYDGGTMRYEIPQNPRGTQLGAGYGYDDEGTAPGVPTRAATDPRSGLAAAEQAAAQPDAYESDEFALHDQRQAPPSRNAQTEGH